MKSLAQTQTLSIMFSNQILFALVALAVPPIAHASLSTSLFPTGHTYAHGFTTASGVSVSGVSSTSLSDSSLNVIKSGQLAHTVVTENGKTAWRADYPEGSWNPDNTPVGGFGFYLGGSDAFMDALPSAKQVVFSYSVMFQSGFEWNKGGKMPGGCELLSFYVVHH